MRRFMICIDNEILFGSSNQKGWGGGACGGMGEGRDNVGIGVETWGKQITLKTLV
jgi:hypothetical protein